MTNLSFGESTDQELIKAIRQGNREAFKELHSRYFKALIRFSWFRTGSMELSRDLVQETFFRVWLKRESLDSSRSVKAFLYKILSNLIISHSRLKSAGETGYDSITSEEGSRTQDDIELKLDLKIAIGKLPEKLKDVYLLSRLDGYKYDEIAEICGITVKAVEKRMSEAFRKLRKSLSEKSP